MLNRVKLELAFLHLTQTSFQNGFQPKTNSKSYLVNIDNKDLSTVSSTGVKSVAASRATKTHSLPPEKCKNILKACMVNHGLTFKSFCVGKRYWKEHDIKQSTAK